MVCGTALRRAHSEAETAAFKSTCAFGPAAHCVAQPGMGRRQVPVLLRANGFHTVFQLAILPRGAPDQREVRCLTFFSEPKKPPLMKKAPLVAERLPCSGAKTESDGLP